MLTTSTLVLNNFSGVYNDLLFKKVGKHLVVADTILCFAVFSHEKSVTQGSLRITTLHCVLLRHHAGSVNFASMR